jgi:hypothetical protein
MHMKITKMLENAKRLPNIGNKTGTEYIQTLRKCDQQFKVQFKAKIFAELTDPNPPKVPISADTIGGNVERSTIMTQGSTEQTKVSVTRATEIKEGKVTEGQVIEFPSRGNMKYVPSFGGPYGIMDRAMRRVAKAVKHRLYKENLLGLINYSVNGNAELDLKRAKVAKVPWQQQINTGFGKTARVWQIREVAEDVEGEVDITVNASAPVDRQELYELLHGLEGRGFGPTDHGSFAITAITP